MHTLRLKHEFQKVLKDYHVSLATHKTLASAKLALLVGVSASGRDTIINELVKTHEFRYIASDTTRPPRINNNVGEVNGREYWFRTEEEFLDDLKSGKLLEAEIIHDQQVSGISVREVEECVRQHKVGITNVDLNVAHIVSAKPDTRAILVLPPSYDVWMKRLNNRGTMHDTEKVRRLRTADRILSQLSNWDFIDIVINDNLSEAVLHVAQLAQGVHQSSAERSANLRVATDLHAAVQTALQQVSI